MATVPEIAKVAKIEVLNLANVPSDYMDPVLWVALQKARILAMLVLQKTSDTTELQKFFDR